MNDKGTVGDGENRLQIVPVEDRFALACQYPSQTNSQGCYIAVNLEKRLMWADYNAEIGNAVPSDVWHGHVRRYEIPALLANVANAKMAEWEPLARRVADGYSSKWDGSNNIARLTEAAEAADEELECLARLTDWDDTDCVQMREARDWFYDVRDEVQGKTDDELEALAKEWEAEALDDDVYITDDVLEVLVKWRDWMAADEEDD